MNSVILNSLSLKFQRLTSSGSKDIKIGKFKLCGTNLVISKHKIFNPWINKLNFASNRYQHID